MAVSIKPLTKAQLVAYFSDYRSAFSDWDIEYDVAFVRSNDAVSQCISFEALRSGAYRPACCVEVCGVPGGRVLFQFLDVRHRQVLPREHTAKKAEIMQAMEEQFLPPIRQPLDTAKVLQLVDEQVARDRIDKANYSLALAALNARMGNFERAESWCDRVPEQLARLGRPPADWEQRHGEYAIRLREAVRQCRIEEFFRAGGDET